MDAEITKLIDAFNGNPVSTGKALRELLEKNPDEFAHSSLRLLRKGLADPDNRGYRYLVTLLATKGILLRLLCEKNRLPREESLIIAKSAARVDPLLDISLLRYLLGEHPQGEPTPQLDAIRVLEIVEAVSEGGRAVPLISQLLKHPDSHIRSKAALLLGRGNRNTKFVGKQLQDEDARVRANALEALWGSTNEESVALFLDASENENNRVAGNALVGLYQAGDTRSIPRLIQMAEHPSPMFRRTAAWAMGETRDPRFLPLLGRLLTLASPDERKTIFRAIAKIKEAVAKLPSNGTLSVRVSQVACEQERRFRMVAGVRGTDAGSIHDLPPTNFVVTFDAEPVIQFQVEHRPAPPRLAVAFALPRLVDEPEDVRVAIHTALTSLLERKRPSEAWVILRYQGDLHAMPGGMVPEEMLTSKSRLFGVEFDEPQRPRASLDSEQLVLGSHAAVLRKAIELPGRRGQAAANGWTAVERLLEALTTTRGSRHLVGIGLEPKAPASAPQSEESLLQLVGKASAARTTVHFIGLKQSSWMSRLARETGGSVLTAVDPEQLAAALPRVYESFHEHFVITGELPPLVNPDSRPLGRLQVFSSWGVGEDTLRLE